MLGEALVEAIVPVSDLEAAISFYEGTLGLSMVERVESVPQNRAARFAASEGSFSIYESVGAGKSRATVAGFRVDDIESVVAGLRERGVAFEDYELPGLKTENGIATIGKERAAWFRDPDGNILAIASR